MPVIVKLPSGSWRAQVRRKGMYVSNSFRRHADASAWALEAERTIRTCWKSAKPSGGRRPPY